MDETQNTPASKFTASFVVVAFYSLRRVRLFVTWWTVAHEAPPSMGCPRQEYWSGLPFPSPGDLPRPGIKPRSPALQVDSLPSQQPGKPKTRNWGHTKDFYPGEPHRVLLHFTRFHVFKCIAQSCFCYTTLLGSHPKLGRDRIAKPLSHHRAFPVFREL